MWCQTPPLATCSPSCIVCCLSAHAHGHWFECPRYATLQQCGPWIDQVVWQVWAGMPSITFTFLHTWKQRRSQCVYPVHTTRPEGGYCRILLAACAACMTVSLCILYEKFHACYAKRCTASCRSTHACRMTVIVVAATGRPPLPVLLLILATGQVPSPGLAVIYKLSYQHSHAW